MDGSIFPLPRYFYTTFWADLEQKSLKSITKISNENEMKTIQAANSKNISRANQKVPKTECLK